MLRKASNRISKYERSKVNYLEKTIQKIDEKLEKKADKKTNNPNTGTRAQKMLLLHYLGALEPITKLPISNTKKAILLSKITGLHKDNFKGDLSIVNLEKSEHSIRDNYEFLVNVFEETGLKDLRIKAEQKLNSIIDAKDKVK